MAGQISDIANTYFGLVRQKQATEDRALQNRATELQIARQEEAQVLQQAELDSWDEQFQGFNDRYSKDKFAQDTIKRTGAWQRGNVPALKEATVLLQDRDDLRAMVPRVQSLVADSKHPITEKQQEFVEGLIEEGQLEEARAFLEDKYTLQAQISQARLTGEKQRQEITEQTLVEKDELRNRADRVASAKGSLYSLQRGDTGALALWEQAHGDVVGHMDPSALAHYAKLQTKNPLELKTYTNNQVGARAQAWNELPMGDKAGSKGHKVIEDLRNVIAAGRKNGQDMSSAVKDLDNILDEQTAAVEEKDLTRQKSEDYRSITNIMHSNDALQASLDAAGEDPVKVKQTLNEYLSRNVSVSTGKGMKDLLGGQGRSQNEFVDNYLAIRNDIKLQEALDLESSKRNERQLSALDKAERKHLAVSPINNTFGLAQDAPMVRKFDNVLPNTQGMSFILLDTDEIGVIGKERFFNDSGDVDISRKVTAYSWDEATNTPMVREYNVVPDRENGGNKIISETEPTAMDASTFVDKRSLQDTQRPVEVAGDTFREVYDEIYEQLLDIDIERDTASRGSRGVQSRTPKSRIKGLPEDIVRKLHLRAQMLKSKSRTVGSSVDLGEGVFWGRQSLSDEERASANSLYIESINLLLESSHYRYKYGGPND